jgi:hypothetical protein
MILTQAQLIEEAARCRKAGILTESNWAKVDVSAYFKMSRVGASFTLNRMARAAVAPQVHEYLRTRTAPPVITPRLVAAETRCLALHDDWD